MRRGADQAGLVDVELGESFPTFEERGAEGRLVIHLQQIEHVELHGHPGQQRRGWALDVHTGGEQLEGGSTVLVEGDQLAVEDHPATDQMWQPLRCPTC